MRFHEALLCVAAIIAPTIATVIFQTWIAPVVAAVVISLPLVWFTGRLVEHTYR